MGMSSSQARLLNLTGRMHQIEYKAAKLEAEKLQMANESRRVYNEYQNSLEQTKVQFGTLTNDGSKTYIDTSLQMLEGNTGYSISNRIFLKDIESGKAYVSPAMAAKYHLDNSGNVTSLDAFMQKNGFLQTINGFDNIPNTVGTTSYIPVATNKATTTSQRTVPNVDPSVGQQAVAPKAAPAGSVNINTVSDFTAGQTYTISDKAGLTKLQNLVNSGKSTAGVNFVLTSDIDMSGVAWTGIGNTSANAFKGNFDGNGHTISNITSNSSGLFKYVIGNQTSSIDSATGLVTTTATQGVIKNVSVTGLNLTSRSGIKGGLIGYAKNAYIDNCYTQGSIVTGNWSGGMIGQNEGSAVSNSTANVSLDATGTCIGGFLGHDTNGILTNCVSKGNITSTTGLVGGLIGHETPQGGVNGSTYIYKCSTTSNITSPDAAKGAFIGQIDGSCAATVVNSSYSAASGIDSCGSGAGNMQSTGSDASLSATATRTVYTTVVTLPSKNSVASNIAMMIDKSGKSVDSSFQAKTMNWLNQFYQEDTNFSDHSLVKSSLKLASINDFVNQYLTNGSNAAVVDALISDINNNKMTATAAYQNNYKETKDYEYSPFVNNSTAMASKKTPVTTPSLNNITNNLYTALHNNGFNVKNSDDITKISNWLSSHYSTSNNAGKLSLAAINDYVTSLANGTTSDKTELGKIYNAIQSNGSYNTAAINHYPSDYYVSAMVNQTQNSNQEWDMSNKEVADAVNYYEIIKDGYIIVTEEQANSTKWFTNMVNSGTTVLAQAKNKESYDTSISTNTSLQEVSDESDLRKAEAKYEADMLKIDRKERKYDYDLSALDNERNAIKQEMETLKTVAKDNVERTFKLFS